MTSTRTAADTDQIIEYLPAGLPPESRPGRIEQLLKLPFRRERAARLDK